MRAILPILAFLLMPSLASGLVILSVSPPERGTCVAPGLESSVRFAIGTNTSDGVPLEIGTGAPDWVSSVNYVIVNGTYDLDVYVDPPIGAREGEYRSEIMICTFGSNETGAVVMRFCVRPVLYVNVSEGCRPPPPPDMREEIRSLVLAALVVVLAITLLRFVKRRKAA